MTEEEWLASDAPTDLVRWDGIRGRARKLRLLDCACARQLEPWFKNPRLVKALDASERYADGLIKDAGLARWATEADRAWEDLRRSRVRDKPSKDAAHYAVTHACLPDRYGCYGYVAAGALYRDRAFGADARAELQKRFLCVVRDIFGNPFRPVAFDPGWRTDTAVSLARGMYDARDFGAMPILGDALQDAGCEDEPVLTHCRAGGAVHVRGCWVVDLVLGKARGAAMRVLKSESPRPLDLLAVGAGGHVAAGCQSFHAGADVDVWDLATGALRFALQPSGDAARAVALTPDGRFLLAGSADGLTVIDLDTAAPARVPDLRAWISSAAVSPDGRRLAAVRAEQGGDALECWAVGPGPVFRSVWGGPGAEDDYNRFAAVAFAPGGEWLAVAAHEPDGDRPDQVIQVRDAETGAVVREIPHPADDPVRRLAFSADGAKLLARADGRTVRVFDTATGRPAGELVHPGRPYVTGVAVHPSGTVACSRTNGTVCLWDLARGALVRTLDWKLGKLVSVAFAPDGSVGAAGTEDGRVVVWDVD